MKTGLHEILVVAIKNEATNIKSRQRYIRKDTPGLYK
jgi:hypothetical protein